jgi:hypothetical protein
VRVGDLVVALVEGIEPAEGEQDHRDQEGVDVAGAGVAELVQRLGCLPGAFAADEQQHLVARVSDRVHALGQHRG